MRRLTVVVALLVMVGATWSQEPPGEEAAPQPPPETAPAESPTEWDERPQPAPAAGRDPGMPREAEEALPPKQMPPERVLTLEEQQARDAAPRASATDQLVERAVTYYEQAKDTPPEVGAWLARNPAVGVIVWVVRRLAGVLTFLGLLLLVGYGARGLVHRMYERPQAELRGYERGGASPASGRWPVILEIIGWALALAIASEAVGLSWLGALVSAVIGLVSLLVGAATWLAVVALLCGVLAWSFSGSGRRLVLSLLGWYYLTRHPQRPEEGQVFTLSDGTSARFVGAEALHSTLATGDDERVSVPNADVMEQHFNWARRVGQGAALQTPPPPPEGDSASQ